MGKLRKISESLSKVIFFHIIPLIIAMVLFIILFWDRFGIWEGAVYPVVGNVSIADVRRNEKSVTFRITYTQFRNCKGVSATFIHGKDILIETRIVDGVRRIPADYKTERITLMGVDSLFNVRAIGRYRCHPFWLTETEFL